MKLATCLYKDQPFVAIVEGEQVVLPALNSEMDQTIWRDMRALISSGISPVTERQRVGEAETVKLKHVTLLAPIPRPAKNVMCLGLNYMDHAEEAAVNAGRQARKPDCPIVFTKSTSSVTAHETEIPFDPDTCSQLDWEAELGVIIGRAGKRIVESDALDHVFGYTVINDISARDIQMQHKQWFLGKSLDGGCPMGPWIVTADELPDPQCLDISCRVNGIEKQHSNTRHMMFSVANTIAWLSRSMTLEAGDVIATGTPSGVGFVRQPPESLLPGDVVECEVEGIGLLRNRIGHGG